MNSPSNPERDFKRFLKQTLLHQSSDWNYAELEDKAFRLAEIMSPELDEREIQAVVAAITSELTVTFSETGMVVDPDTFDPWLADRRAETETPRWDAYEKILVDRDWDNRVIAELDRQSDEALELLGDPTKPGEWARRGLLLGEVQSGKTANYLALLNKALDYGYRVVIVIGGHTNELRRQTQQRFDTDLLGIDSEYLDDNIAHATIPRIGIGEHHPELQTNVMTTVRGDFNANRKTAGITWVNSPIPTVFVIKKNAKLIANVANYIRLQAGKEKMSIPLVLIDDESDWGTPNTGSETDPSRVNKEIRRLLDSSTRSSYLGITATPFANIFIDHEAKFEETGVDLFPKDYIRALPAPSTYFGLTQYFLPGHGGLRLSVEDCIEVIPIIHKSSHQVDALPDSLRTALIAFLLGTALRRRRAGRRVKASMLVNVSRFNLVQSQIYDLLTDFLGALRAMVIAELMRSAKNKSALYRELFGVWNDEYPESAECPFSEIKPVLLEIISEFRVELVNSQTAAERRRQRRSLNTAQRAELELQPTIYVGGDVLSRGITLEGLQVSYFVREPRTMDTLMQMGRWFGYRNGYSDLVRVWLPQATADDFAWSAEVTLELNQMLVEMRSRQLTPKQFGLRVRTHPEGLKIVAANKSKSTGVVHQGPVLWENCMRESYRIEASQERQALNYDAVTRMLLAMASSPEVSTEELKGGHKSWANVPVELVREFFLEFRGHTSDVLFGAPALGQPAPILDALDQSKSFELWDVCLVSGNDGTHSYPSGDTIQTSVRNKLKLINEYLEFDRRRVATGSSLLASFSKAEMDDFYRAGSGVDNADNPLSQQVAALAHIGRPRLLIFTVSAPNPKDGLGPAEFSVENPLVAVAVAFPKMDPEEAVRAASSAKEYRVNSVWLQNYYSPHFEGEEDYEEELED